jgi:hypothetical protein
MELYESKKFLHSERNGHQIEEAVHRMGENVASFTPNKGFATRINRELKKLNSQKNQ